MSNGAPDKLIYEFSAFRLDPVERLLLRDGRAVPLTPKAFDLLVYLLERHGRLVEKHALMAALWPDTVVEEANLAYNVSALRKVLDDGEEAASVIQTVPTRGYRFVAPVKTSRRMQLDPATDLEAVRLGLPGGETLAVQLTHGPLPLTQLLLIGIDIAGALEAAHRQGIVHGGLTAGNVILTPAGTKLQNFGLANTMTVEATLPYMAPEQALGLPTDARTDLYALGAILHEMAAGQQAWAALDRIIQGCLARDPVDRWQSAHDVKLQLQGIQGEVSRVEAAAPPTLARRRTMWIPWAVAAACVALAATTLRSTSRPAVTQPRPIRLDLTVPAEMQLDDFNRGAISPDGRRFVFEATVDGLRRLVLRDLASATLVVLVGTDGGYNPFWSPDSQSVAFFDTESRLKQIAVTGRPVRVLAKTTYVHGAGAGTWGPGVILIESEEGRIYRVAATGGTAAALDTLPWKPGQRRYASPRFLPDGRHFLVTVVDDPALYVASLDASGMRKVMADGTSAVYAAGHLFYSRRAGVFARPFDVERLEFSGAEMQLTERPGEVSVSDQGTIVYRPDGVSLSTLTWFDRSGRRTGTVGEPGPYVQLVLSPRGRHATVVRGDAQGNAWDLWDADLASGIFSRLTTDPADDADPSWSPDERSLAFVSWRTGRKAVFEKDLTSGKEDPLVPFDEDVA